MSKRLTCDVCGTQSTQEETDHAYIMSYTKAWNEVLGRDLCPKCSAATLQYLDGLAVFCAPKPDSPES